MNHPILSQSTMPVAQVAQAGPFLLIGGQDARHPNTGQEVGLTLNENGGVLKYDMAVQTRQAIENLSAVLNKAGYTLQHVVDITVFLAHLDDYAVFYKTYQACFDFERHPACTVVQAMSPGRSFISLKAMAYRAV